MAVKITKTGVDENGLPVFEALDLATNETVETKNWYEKSKEKWHIVLKENSANRKYVAHNEFFTKAVNDEYIVEDKTTGPRSLGTSQPDKALIPFMTEDEKADYDAIIARAQARKEAEKNKPMSEEEKLEKQIAALQARLAKRRSEVEELTTVE